MHRTAFIIGLLLVAAGILTPLVTTVVTTILPETFASSARVSPAAANPTMLRAAAGTIVSPSSINQVITNLNLAVEWGRKHRQTDAFSPDQCSAILSKMVETIVIGNGGLIEIKVFSDNKDEAAVIANQFAALFVSATPGASIVEQAQPNPKPVRPNKRLNILISLGVGTVLAANGIILLFAARKPKQITAASR